MLDTPTKNPERETPKARGHLIGISDSPSALDDVPAALNSHGIDSERIFILQGEGGLEQFEEMMEGSQWGEDAEKFLAQGRIELKDGHAIVCVEVPDDEEAARVTQFLTPLGIRSIHHFGALIDTQLTK